MFSDVTEKFYIRKALQDDLLLARKIQKSIISEKHQDDIPEMNFFIHYQPMGEVGGDFYDISKIMPSKKIRIFITDATGHGVQGALTTMLIKSEYEKVKIFDLPPNRLLDIVNNNFCALYPNMRIYFTCFIADIDLNEMVIQYSAAGHPGQFLLRGQEIFTMNCRGRYLGIFEKSEYQLKEIEIKKNDRLFLFTDGLFEEFSDSDEIFGHENLKDVITANVQPDLDQHARSIIMDVFSFKGWREMNDDITFIVTDILKN
jgi:sigma-B regulation protein RsbU (phosphoserine phosphatase)